MTQAGRRRPLGQQGMKHRLASQVAGNEVFSREAEIKQRQQQFSQVELNSWWMSHTPERPTSNPQLGLCQIKDLTSQKVSKRDFIKSVRENFRDTLKTSG